MCRRPSDEEKLEAICGDNTYLLTYLHLFGKAGQMNGQLYS